MSCPKHPEISAYIDNMLVPLERDELRLHLQTCPVCRQRLDALEQLRHGLRELSSPTLGFDLSARLGERMRAETMRRRPARPFWFGWGSAALAVTLSLASGLWIGGFLIGRGVAAMPVAPIARVFDPVPPGGLCAAVELCRLSKGMQ